MSSLDVNAYGARTAASMQRRGMCDPVPSVAEVKVRAHAETSEVFEAWLRRQPSKELWESMRQLMSHGGRSFCAEWIDADGKPEGVAAELADVVLTCCYLMHRIGHRPTELTPLAYPNDPSESVVELIGMAHASIDGGRYQAAIRWCFTIAARLVIDLHAALERKADYNDVRPATSRRL